MDNIKVVAVDAMGGDNAPVEIVKGCVEAVKEREDIKVLLVGLADVVQAELTKYTYPTDRIEVVPASQVIETAEPPVMAIRKKKRRLVRITQVMKMDEMCTMMHTQRE